ncbi:hypothetical protein pipiens_010655 [Culex pipiens pipiens]|uniref:Uncharacterized protein n=1 Tax=Culex pipiens pipiens TaxID=38569 RepID=A0ABD1D9E7_CULPP
MQNDAFSNIDFENNQLGGTTRRIALLKEHIVDRKNQIRLSYRVIGTDGEHVSENFSAGKQVSPGLENGVQPVAELRITVDRVKEGSKVGLEYEYDELPLPTRGRSLTNCATYRTTRAADSVPARPATPRSTANDWPTTSSYGVLQHLPPVPLLKNPAQTIHLRRFQLQAAVMIINIDRSSWIDWSSCNTRRAGTNFPRNGDRAQSFHTDQPGRTSSTKFPQGSTRVTSFNKFRQRGRAQGYPQRINFTTS